MSLSSLSIRRPVLASVMSIVIILFGVISFFYLGVREYPSVDPPIVTVSSSYVGANAEVIESQITEPLEESINGIAGIRTLTSVSREGRSTITVEFDLEIDLETAANDVRDRVSRAQGQLPPDADPPTVTKADADRTPIVFLNVNSDRRSLLDLSAIADNIFKEQLQTIPGVSSIQIWGDKEYSMRLWMDPLKLSAYGVTPLDVQAALQRENVELPSGRIEGQTTELSVRTMGRLETAEEFNNLIIREEEGRKVRFRDIGNAELGALNERTVLKRNGVPMVGVVAMPQPGSNQLDIAEEFFNRVERIERDLPEDISLAVGFDTSEYIQQSVNEVEQTIFLALALVIAVIFLFLRDWRTTLIPIIVIPIALIGAFFVMYVAGFSINVLTMLAIVLAIGLVVDDAIVVLENIYAKMEQGLPTVEAGILGSKEIFFAVIATSLALVSVFLPILFLGGTTGRLFREFGVVIAGAVIISSFVALTLTPMLATKILSQGAKKNRFYKMTEPFFLTMNNAYKSSLESFMKMRWLAFVILAVAFGFIALLYATTPKELAPLEDRGQLRLFATGPEGASFEYMDNYVDRMIETVEENVPELQAINTVTSPGFGASTSTNSAFGFLTLVDKSERDRSQQEIANQLSSLMTDLSGAQTFVSQPQSIGNRRGGLPVQYVLQAQNLSELEEVIPDFVQAANNHPAFNFAEVDLKFNQPEVQLSIDRDRARVLGVSVRDIARTLQLSLSGSRFGYFIIDGKQYEVIGQMERQYRNEPIDLRTISVRSASGQQIQLDNLVSLRETSAPPQLFRFNRFSAATVSASLSPGYTIGDGIDAMNEISAEVLPPNFITDLSGPSRDFAESAASLNFIFGLALILIYLVLAAQFESFRDPFIILFTVPLAIFGTLLSLWYFNQTLNIFSQIGAIMLIGLVAKNGILIVEFANQRQEQGMNVMEAIKDAAAVRFRPILMTTISTILGILPIALALGAGAESRTSMGIAVIGGLFIGSFLTLYVIPAIYSYFATEKDAESEILKKARKAEKMEPASV
ncbi:efflux RND transporter permease subunit [Rhodohalobacter sulfatireducens]|uniref:Efflux RND transporter permease subunit n=1 Tax=Rhodohalobacter sulfatireducens TaxID=2911366 RepID=A0ABS9KAJ8_9BACT|nr:efflux RND transporter permease subunit [Rhodohalobacter sulfatireducens]MCG2587842.1 efflux RND transporter permease subunit [Rhodohalobacter sulfatireducens]